MATLRRERRMERMRSRTVRRSARGTVVKGKIVTRAKFPEGAKLTILMDDDRPAVALSREDEAAMLRGISEIKAGRGVPLAEFLEILHRL